MSTEIFKILRCRCGWQRWDVEPVTDIPACPKCGQAPKYSANWYTKVYVNGKRHIQSIGRQKRHAEQVLNKTRADIVYDKFSLGKDSPLLSTAITTLYNLRWKKKKDGEGTRRRAELLQEIIGDLPLNQINGTHMQALASALAARQTGDSTANRYRSVLRSILKHHQLPYAFINMDPETEGRIHIITDQEEATLIKLFSEAKTTQRRGHYPEMPDFITVLLDTGLRAEELLGLPKTDINFQTGLLTSWINKADKPRSVPMTSRVKKILKARVKAEGTALFAINIYQADKAWAWARKQMGLQENADFVIHACRHTCATRLLIAGVDVYRVKEWLGHKSLKTTERYIHLIPQNLGSALTLLEKRKPSTKRQRPAQHTEI